MFATLNWDKSATRFCCQVSAWVPAMFWDLYLVKSHKIGNSAEAREKFSADLESLES
jgi:hypothetical protein